MFRRFPTELIVGMLVILFVYTGVSKLIDFSQFSWQMSNQPLPKELTSALTWMIPIVELVIAALLVYKKLRLYGLVLSFLLLLNFSLYVGLILNSVFDYVPCSCAGIFEQMSWSQHLVVNIVFMLMALVGTYFEWSEKFSRKHPV